MCIAEDDKLKTIIIKPDKKRHKKRIILYWYFFFLQNIKNKTYLITFSNI